MSSLFALHFERSQNKYGAHLELIQNETYPELLSGKITMSSQGPQLLFYLHRNLSLYAKHGLSIIKISNYPELEKTILSENRGLLFLNDVTRSFSRHYKNAKKETTCCSFTR